MFCAYDSNVGLKRDENQDRVRIEFLGENISVAAVCDGMGGAASGGIASQIAIDAFFERVMVNFRPEMNENSIRNLLVNAVQYANTLVYEKSREDAENNGMGTTCVAALVRGRSIHVVSVGDSRAYLLDDKGIRQITTDHTFVGMLYETGQITAEEAKVHPMRNMITKAVGVEPDIEVDYFGLDEDGNFDVFLCSDGLSGYCSDELIYKTVFGNNLDKAVAELIAYANECGGKDNITAAVVAN
ncbi:MAG: Stp1/IreP family PP2C-type Ser/Thr phosphatase [Ruminococcus sp.]|nr:Stp1/IreP family PP2C-type Ser/Thr phosphatase [Ruminococcus sp.]